MKRIIPLLLILCVNLNISAQILEKLEGILSPNATSLGEYGETPVSLYTGTVSVEIPLYELTYGDVSIPISLSYHGSGVKPDQHPGWVGLGWNLNAGGMISRKTNDLPDDYNNPTRYEHLGAWVSEYLTDAGFYFRRDLNSDNWNTTSTLVSKVSNGTCVYDTEPDEYSFQFLNYSGKFYLNSDGTWNVQCDKSLKVKVLNEKKSFVFSVNGNHSPVYNSVYHTTSFGGFEVTDDKGIKYIFGNTKSSVEYSISFFHQVEAEWYANSWMLTKIILPTGEEITFDYDRKELVNQMYTSVYRIMSGSISWQTDFEKWESSGCKTNAPNEYDIFQGQLITPVYLKQITTPANKAVFLCSPTKELRYSEKPNTSLSLRNNPYETKSMQRIPWPNSDVISDFLPYLMHWNSSIHSLDGISMEYPSCLKNLIWYQLDNVYIQNNNSTIKGYTMEYSRNPKQRLTLYAVKEDVPSGPRGNKKYSFNYYNMEGLPEYLGFETDHWGYFNNTLRTPSDTAGLEPTENLEIATRGALKSITYPTGGVTEFTYGQHKYMYYLDGNRWKTLKRRNSLTTAGGIRIESVTHYPDGMDYPDTKYSKKYEYDPQTAVLEGITQYSFTYSPQLRGNNGYGDITVRSTQSVLPCTNNSLGSHIGYGTVREIRSDGGRTEYKFTNFDNGENMDSPYESTLMNQASPYSPCNMRTMNRGKLISETTYDGTGIQSTKTIKYKKIPDESSPESFVRAMRISTKEICYSGGFYDQAESYKIFTYSLLPEKTTETFYNSNHAPALVNETSYEYNSDKLVSKTTTTNSEGKTVIKRTKYVGDAPDGDQNTLCQMKKLRLLAYPVQETESLVNGSEQVIGAKYYKYALYNQTAGSVGSYKMWSENQLSITSPVTNFLNIDMGAADLSPDTRFRELIRYNNYDRHGNPQFITKNGVENAVYLWGYNYQHPILEVKNATLEDVKKYISTAQIEEMGAGGVMYLNEIDFLRKNLPNSLVTSYTYIASVGPWTITNPNNTKLYYEYDNNGRLQRIYRKRGDREIIEKIFRYNFSNY